MLRTKPIKSIRLPEDGVRISIMSRHTLSDGLTPDLEITEKHYDQWWPELAPKPKLVGAYYRNELGWNEFEDTYRAQLKQIDTARKVSELIDLASIADVTLLCIEENPDRCHRRLLAEECLVLQPGLEVDIN